MSASQESFQTRSIMTETGRKARAAARMLARADTALRNNALLAIAEAIEASLAELLAANTVDLQNARERNLDAPLVDRLQLDEQRIGTMAQGLREIATLPDPVGQVTDLSSRPSGIQVGRMRVPLGVIGIIYESRPNVTADAAALCLKAGNATILRGGSEAITSNQAIAKCIRAGLATAGLNEDAVQVVETTDRAAVGELLRMKQYVDVIVPRGGKGLIERVSEESLIPVIKHLDGVCHVYVDSDADLDKAVSIALNAKTQRYGTCCTMETLLVAADVAQAALPRLRAVFEDKGVELRGCEHTREIVDGISAASEEDWYAEYLAPILAVRVVETLDDAMDHIERYGSAHTDSIVTENYSNAQRFLREVDSSSVMVNTSTRFADGFEYGLGAEIGISTDKLHVRGPVGLEGLTTQKFIVMSDGRVRT